MRDAEDMGMQEYERKLLEQYHIEVRSTRKIRGAILCDTEQGLFLLRELPVSENRIPLLCELYDHLIREGYTGVDHIVPNQEGEAVSCAEDGGKYILKTWYAGRECDVRKPAELLEGAGNLAKLHCVMRVPMEHPAALAEHLKGTYMRHSRELKKVRRFIREQSPKGEFEFAFLKCFDQMYEWIRAAQELLEDSAYDELYGECMENHWMIHGEYNYHNILMRLEDGRYQTIATVNFERVKREIQVEDLYYFLRKTMEKYGWKERLGDGILNAYSAIKPLTKNEVEYLKLRLVYPEKFWKVANAYYHSNKAWIPVKSIEKLNMAICQTREKEQFLENIFSFHL